MPARVEAAQSEFDAELAKRFDSLADALESGDVKMDAVAPALARLEDASRTHAADLGPGSPTSLDTFVALSRRMGSLTASVSEAVRVGLVG